MNAITTFAFDDQMVRTVMRGAEPWFAGKDVCQCLEIADHHQALDRLDEEELGRCNVPTQAGSRQIKVINEPGVYQLVFTSRSPAAKHFKRWLAHEVLPALRRTGQFSMTAEPAASHEWPTPAQETSMASIMNALCRSRGPAAANEYYDRSTFPRLQSRGYVGDAPAPDQDGERCLKRLLAYKLLNGMAVGEVLLHAWTDDVARQRLAHCGVLVAPGKNLQDIVAIADRHEVLAEIFERTPWKAHWRVALLTLDGARPAPRPRDFGGTESSCVLMPKACLPQAS